MTIKYGEYKDFLRCLRDFMNPAPRNSLVIEQITQYLEDNVNVEVPDDLFDAVGDYQIAERKLNDAITTIVSEEFKRQKEEIKKKRKRCGTDET